ncbi:hypothetical protein EAG_06721 [Camponotus floridanus]|uniref:Uncharacterized protein n=1 Tax=Camponotus floridanus TaxID=104421 RepID=E2A034_CAMFO|nr:hypothetical protein EAG_06721 [Camponotus floridanus]
MDRSKGYGEYGICSEEGWNDGWEDGKWRDRGGAKRIEEAYGGEGAEFEDHAATADIEDNAKDDNDERGNLIANETSVIEEDVEEADLESKGEGSRGIQNEENNSEKDNSDSDSDSDSNSSSSENEGEEEEEEEEEESENENENESDTRTEPDRPRDLEQSER